MTTSTATCTDTCMPDGRRIFGTRVFAEGVTTQSVSRNNNNDLVIGPSGSGKTRGYVAPNILQLAESFIVTDPKGSLVEELGGTLCDCGYKVMELDFSDLSGWEQRAREDEPWEKIGYNPLDFVRTRADGAYNLQDIQAIAHALCVEGGHYEPYWENAAAQFLTAYLAFAMEALPKSERSLASAARMLAAHADGSLVNVFEEHRLSHERSLACALFDQANSGRQSEKTVASVIGVLSQKLDVCQGEGARSLFGASRRVDFAELGEGPCALFVTVSDTDRSQDALVGLLYSQALAVLCRKADHSYGAHLAHPVRFFLDDFATNCVIPDFDKISSNVRSRDISASVMLQSVTQLDALYGPARAATIMNNCDHWLYLGGQDTKTVDLMARRLSMPADAVYLIPDDEAVVITRGQKPVVAKKYELLKSPSVSPFEPLDECFDNPLDDPFYEPVTFEECDDDDDDIPFK